VAKRKVDERVLGSPRMLGSWMLGRKSVGGRSIRPGGCAVSEKQPVMEKIRVDKRPRVFALASQLSRGELVRIDGKEYRVSASGHGGAFLVPAHGGPGALRVPSGRKVRRVSGSQDLKDGD